MTCCTKSLVTSTYLDMQYLITDYSAGSQGDHSLKRWVVECDYAETLWGMLEIIFSVLSTEMIVL